MYTPGLAISDFWLGYATFTAYVLIWNLFLPLDGEARRPERANDTANTPRSDIAPACASPSAPAVGVAARSDNVLTRGPGRPCSGRCCARL
jgi:hypothetical protein